MYAGSFAGVWRSDDGGRELVSVDPAATGPGRRASRRPGRAARAARLRSCRVADRSGRRARVRDRQPVSDRQGRHLSHGRRRSELDAGAADDRRVQHRVCTGQRKTRLRRAGYVVAISQDAGASWTFQWSAGVFASHIAVGPLEADGKRRVYAEGFNAIWCSLDGGATWTADMGVTAIIDARQVLHDFQNACLGGVGGLGGFRRRHRLRAEEPRAKPWLSSRAIRQSCISRPRAAQTGRAFSPQAFRTARFATRPARGSPAKRACGGATSASSNRRARHNGRCYPARPSRPTRPPAATSSWSPRRRARGSSCSSRTTATCTLRRAYRRRRIPGIDSTGATSRRARPGGKQFVHVDPHGIAFTPDFEIRLVAATGVDPPFDQSAVLQQFIGGTIWMANDGGVHWSEDGGRELEPAAWGWRRSIR